MPLDVSCPSCKKAFNVPDQSVGKNAKCSKCGTRFVIGANSFEDLLDALSVPAEVVPDPPYSPLQFSAMPPVGPVASTRASYDHLFDQEAWRASRIHKRAPQLDWKVAKWIVMGVCVMIVGFFVIEMPQRSRPSGPPARTQPEFAPVAVQPPPVEVRPPPVSMQPTAVAVEPAVPVRPIEVPDPIPDDVTYTIIEQYSVLHYKKSFDIRLNREVSEDVLRAIATKLKNSDSSTYERTFISYYLPGMVVGAGSWASTHYTPKLDVRIHGLGHLTSQREAMKEYAEREAPAKTQASRITEVPEVQFGLTEEVRKDVFRLIVMAERKASDDAQKGLPLDPRSLDIGQVFQLTEETPLVPGLKPVDPIAAIGKIRRLPAGTYITVFELAHKTSGFPWYQVEATDQQKNPLGRGWVNSVALTGQAGVETKQERLRQYDIEDELLNKSKILIAAQHRITVDQLDEIGEEGLAKHWSMPAKRPR